MVSMQDSLDSLDQLSRVDLEQYRLQGLELTSRSLGTGSHADVAEVRYKGLTCAAKTFHFVKHKDYKNLKAECSRRCYQYCCLLGKLRHPNIVQFIGFYDEPYEPLPTLVYECLHTTLSACIQLHGLLPDSINYSILRDVAMALRYLHEHSPPIPHGSLTASKVLLTRDMTAKLTNVGVTCVTEIGQQHGIGKGLYRNRDTAPAIVISSCSETAVRHDIYSYGMLMVHMISGKTLLSELAALEYSHSVSICESDLVELLLVDIREDHILLELMEKCLQTDPKARPSTITVLHKMSEISSKHPPLFTNSLEMLERIKDDAENQLNMSAKLKSLSPEASFDSSPNELDKLKELVTKISAQNAELQARLSSRGSLSYQSGEAEDVGVMLSQQQKLQRQDNQCITSPLHIRQGQIKWTECSDLPVGMFQGQAVHLRGRIYVGGGSTGDHLADALIFEYSPRRDTWTALPHVGASRFGLCKLEGELVAVGGIVGAKVTPSVVVFDTFTKRWKSSLPPLDNARHSPGCVSLQSAIVVCGGVSPEGDILSSVEVMKSDSFQWYTAGYLSRAATLTHASMVAVYDTVYILGGYKSSTANSSSNKVHSSSVEMLLSSYSGMTPYAWSAMPPTPYYQTTAAHIGTCLVSLGGTECPYAPPVYRTINAFSPSSKSWVYVGDLPYEFCHGTAVSLPNNELYIMGGWIQPGKFKRSCKVYKASVKV